MLPSLLLSLYEDPTRALNLPRSLVALVIVLDPC